MDCALESGLRPHLSFSRTRALLEAWRDGKGSDTRLEAQAGGAGRAAQAFSSFLLPGGGASSGVWGNNRLCSGGLQAR